MAKQKTRTNRVIKAYLESGQGYDKTIPMIYLDKLAERMYDYFFEDNPQAVVISEFLSREGVPERTYTEWLKRCHKLKYVHGLVKQVIGDRSVSRAFDKKACPKMAQLLAARNFTDSWRETFKFMSEFKHGASQEKNQGLVIKLDAFDEKPVEEVKQLDTSEYKASGIIDEDKMDAIDEKRKSFDTLKQGIEDFHGGGDDKDDS